MASLDALLVTFNCGRELAKPDVFARHLVDALPSSSNPDLIIFSLQEIAPIAYSFLGGSFLVPYLEKIRHAVTLAAESWNGSQYLSLLTRNLGMTVIMLFIRDDLSENVRWMETGGVGVGVHEMGNKGAVGIRLGYAVQEETLEMTFVAAHLAPMEDALERRNEDWKNIVRGLVFTPVDGRAVRVAARPRRSQISGDEEPLLSGSPDNDSDPTSGIFTSTSHLFFAGDLNYRTSVEKPTLEDYPKFPQPTSNIRLAVHYSHLLKKDQLSQEMRAHKTCHGLVEAPIDFPPTYKYSDKQRAIVEIEERKEAVGKQYEDSQSSQWKWAMHRWPSWCDRILYLDLPPWMKSSSATKIQVHKYIALPLMSSSDHRPVLLSISIPLATIPPPNDEAMDGDWRIHPPFPINPQWREKRASARRKELVVGVFSYLGLTWEGNGVLLATIVGALSGWAVIWSMLTDP